MFKDALINNVLNIAVLDYLLKLSEAIAKNGWFHKDCINGTAAVSGSLNQCQAPAAVHIDIMTNITAKFIK